VDTAVSIASHRACAIIATDHLRSVRWMRWSPGPERSGLRRRCRRSAMWLIWSWFPAAGSRA